MPIEIGLWRISEKPESIAFSQIDTEQRLEEMLFRDVGLLDPSLLLIGRQVPTAFGKFVDLLALDAEGRLVVIELKRNRTPREVVAQLLDYGSWVRSLEDEDIAAIYEASCEKYGQPQATASLDQAFMDRFNVKQMPEALNESHELVVVAAELDDSTERIITYLTEEYGVAINAVFFRFFKDGDSEYLTRAWLTEPDKIDATVEEKREKLPWNGEYYASYGVGEHRSWEEARKYGFISGGGGSWYSKTLRMLEPRDRVWVNIPGKGYVGVARVLESEVPIDNFQVEDDHGNRVPITSLPLRAAYHTLDADDPDKAEHFVRVEWIKTVSEAEAIREKGFFGNQNSVAKPRCRKWQHTVERLKKRFSLSD